MLSKPYFYNPPSEKNVTKIVIYARHASTGQEADESLDLQVKECKAYAMQQGYEVLAVFTDDAKSGISRERPGLTELLLFVESLKRKKQNDGLGVLVRDMGRMAREKDLLHIFRSKLIQLGCVLVATKQTPYDPMDGFFESLTAVMLQFENYLHINRLIDGRYKRVSKGYWVSRPPYGYDLVDGVLLPNSDSKYVQRVFQEFADGAKGIKDLVDDSRALAVQKHIRRPLSSAQLTRMLFNVAYVGKTKFYEQTFDGKHEPLVSEELFKRVQTRLTQEEQS